MKIVLSWFLSISLLSACNSGKKKESKHHGEDTAVEHTHAPAEKAGTLELNQGAKWKADSLTIANVARLKATIAGAEKKGLENYGKVATELQADINKMVSECKMTGPDHEALHHWLEPIIENTKALGEISSSEKAGSLLTDIEKQVNRFDQYFE